MQYLELPAVTGMLVITHVKSQSFYIVQSQHVRDAGIMANGQLKLGTYQSIPLQTLYNENPELDYTYVETNTMEEARLAKHNLMAKHYGDERLLNQQDYPKLTGVFSLTHQATGVVYWGSTQDIVKQHSYHFMLLKNNKHKSPRLQELFNEDAGCLSFGFEICQNDEQARALVVKRMDEAAALGLSANKGLAKRQHQGPGVYILTFADGMFYIGSSAKVANRISWHKYALKNGTHTNPVMQKVYDRGDKVYAVQVDPYPTKESALEAEQILLDQAKGNDQCMNLATNVAGPASYVWTNPEHRKTYVAAIRKSRRKDEARAAHCEVMKKYWSDPEAKAKRTGAGNPFAKRIRVNGVEYGSLMDAIRAKAMPNLRKRLKDPNDLDAVYID